MAPDGRMYYPQARAIVSLVFDGFGGPETDTPPQVFPVLPRSLTVHLNAYNQADSWEMTFDGEDLPIDPALIRAGAAEIFLFASQKGLPTDDRLIDKQFATLDAPPEQVDRSATQAVLEEAGAGSIERFTQGNEPMVAGLIDDIDLSADEGGRWVTISGQDYTALLMQRQWPPTSRGRARRIPVGRKLDELLASILDEADETGRLKLVLENVSKADMPIVRERRNNKRGIPIEEDTSYWDVLYKLATRYGFILFVRGLSVVLTRAQNLGENRERRARTLVVGKNVAALQMTRHMGKESAPKIVVRAYDPGLREPITVDYPRGTYEGIKQINARNKKKDTTTTRFSTKPKRKKKADKAQNIRKQEEYMIIPVFGVTDRAVLQNIAEQLHNQFGKAERTVTVSTEDLSDIDDRDLMDVRAGDSLSIDFKEFNIDRALLSDDDIGVEEKYNHLVSRGYGSTIARVIAEKYKQLQALKRPLRVRDATYDYDVDSGVSIELQALDFVVIGDQRDATSKKARKEKRKTKKDGTQLGPSKAQEEAFRKQHGGGA